MAIEKRSIGDELVAEIETRDLTDRELVALWHLSQAWNAFYDPEMDREPHDRIDLEEFMHAIHSAQNIIMARNWAAFDIHLKED